MKDSGQLFAGRSSDDAPSISSGGSDLDHKVQSSGRGILRPPPSDHRASRDVGLRKVN